MPFLGLGTQDSKDQECEQAIVTALNNGYRHIDTALMFGNEQIVGMVAKRMILDGKLRRKDIFISTKLMGAALHPARVGAFTMKSLDNFDLGYIDLLMIHFPIGINFEAFAQRGELKIDGRADLAACWRVKSF